MEMTSLCRWADALSFSRFKIEETDTQKVACCLAQNFSMFEGAGAGLSMEDIS